MISKKDLALKIAEVENELLIQVENQIKDINQQIKELDKSIKQTDKKIAQLEKEIERELTELVGLGDDQ